MPLTRVELDRERCDTPGCNCAGAFYLHSRCHPDAPTWANYEDGVLTIECAVCDSSVAAIAVAT